MLDWVHNFLDHMPEQASTWAARVDWLNNFISYIAAFCTFGITAVMLYFAVRYRRRSDNDKTPQIVHNSTIETVWTAIPTVICFFVFYLGLDLYREMRTPPANPVEISVEGYQWGWNFTYSSGKKSGAELVVPVGKPVRLVMRSKDVNHSFYIPSMRVKEDVIASNYSYLWFQPTELKDYPIFCTEYCGLNHSQMLATLKVVPYEQYIDYINNRSKEQLPPEQIGAKAYKDRACMGCHSLDGTAVVGPSFKGLYGLEREFTDGTKATADEGYLREAILLSQKKIVKGYPAGAMPVFEGVIPDEEVDGLIAFIKQQK